MNLHEKIINYCFESDNIYCRLKSNSEIIDCSDLSSEGLQEQLNELFENLIHRISLGRDICYDAYANALMDVFLQTRICPKPIHLFNYADQLLKLEASFPLELVSLSLFRCLILLIQQEDLIESEYWYHLYDTGPEQLKHVFACGIFSSAGFDEDLFYDVCQEVNYSNLFFMMQESKVIPNQVSLEDLRVLNASFPDEMQTKIMRDCKTKRNLKNIVYN